MRVNYTHWLQRAHQNHLSFMAYNTHNEAKTLQCWASKYHNEVQTLWMTLTRKRCCGNIVSCCFLGVAKLGNVSEAKFVSATYYSSAAKLGNICLHNNVSRFSQALSDTYQREELFRAGRGKLQISAFLERQSSPYHNHRAHDLPLQYSSQFSRVQQQFQVEECQEEGEHQVLMRMSVLHNVTN